MYITIIVVSPNIQPRSRKTIAHDSLVPLEKEFVIDIDLTDYDAIRTCCKEGDVCTKCWKLVNIAIRCIDTVLRGAAGASHTVVIIYLTE